MATNDTEKMRQYLKLLEHSEHPVEHTKYYVDDLEVLEEGPIWNSIWGLINSAFKRTMKFQWNTAWIQKALVRYLRSFELVMGQYKQTYATLTWNSLIQFLLRNRAATQLDIGGGVQGQQLTRDDIIDIFKDDRQVLVNILKTSRVPLPGNPMTLIPQGQNIFSSTYLKAPVGGANPANADKVAQVIVSAVLEAAIVVMIEKHEGTAEPGAAGATGATGAAGTTGAGGGTAGTPGGGTAGTAPPASPTGPGAAGTPPAATTVTPQQAASLRQILGIP